jgi:hypothetical protein
MRPVRYAAPLLLVATPLVALGAKWINFGYFPIMPQLQFIGVVAILGVLAGLALRQCRIAFTALVVLAVALCPMVLLRSLWLHSLFIRNAYFYA